jgi:hypothetical protein
VPRRASMHDAAHAPRSGPTTLPNGNVCVMSRFRWSAQLPPILQARWIPYANRARGLRRAVSVLDTPWRHLLRDGRAVPGFICLPAALLQHHRRVPLTGLRSGPPYDARSSKHFCLLGSFHHPFTSITASSPWAVHRDVQPGSRGAHADVPRCRIIG